MMTKIRRLFYGVIGGVLAVGVSPTLGEDLSGLDRGHRLLIEHGFQLVALVDADLTSEVNWKKAGYTTMMFSDHYVSHDAAGQIRAGDLAQFSGTQWGRLTWRPETSSTNLRNILTKDEKPYTSKLTMLQYLDEQLINKPEIVEDAKIVLADWRKRYPRAISFTNQVGGVWKPEVLEHYVKQARPDMLYFDRYVFKGRLAGKPEDEEHRRHYLVLQRTREAAQAGHADSGHKPIPFGMYTQNTVIPRNDHTASESETRFQYFTALAFGCKSIAAFTYARDIRTDKLRHYMFRGANTPDMPNDTGPLPLFFVFADCNRQTLSLAPTLLRLLSTDVRVLPGRKANGELNSLKDTRVKAWDAKADPYITSITAANPGKLNGGRPGDVVVGYFKPLLYETTSQRSDDLSFMIVNGLTHPKGSIADTTQTITVTFDFADSPIRGLERVNRENGQVEEITDASKVWTHVKGSIYKLDLTLPGGSGDLFRFQSTRSSQTRQVPEG